MVPDTTRRPSRSSSSAVPTTRRAVLGAGGAAVCLGLAGCSGSGSESDSEDDPDAGRDSYGVVIMNDLDASYTVSLRGEDFLEHETVWEETAEVAAGATREFEQVFTEPKQFMVYASVDSDDFPERYRSDNNSVNVGKESSPLAENVRVFLRMWTGPEDDRFPVLWVRPPREE